MSCDARNWHDVPGVVLFIRRIVVQLVEESFGEFGQFDAEFHKERRHKFFGDPLFIGIDR